MRIINFLNYRVLTVHVLKINKQTNKLFDNQENRILNTGGTKIKYLFKSSDKNKEKQLFT